MSLDNSVGPVEQVSFIYQHQLSTLCSNENRAAMIMYRHISIPFRIDLDHSSTHPAIRKLKKQFQCNGGFKPIYDLALEISTM